MSARRVAVLAAAIAALVAVVAVWVWPDGGSAEPANDEVVRDSTEALDMVNEALGGTQAVQDFVIFIDLLVQTDEDEVSFYGDLLEEARRNAEHPMTLVDRSGSTSFDATWTAVNSLKGEVVTPEGEVLPTVSVDFGLLGLTPDGIVDLKAFHAQEGDLFALSTIADLDPTGSQSLVQIVTADYTMRRTHMSPEDMVGIGTAGVPGVEPGDSVAAIYVFGQTHPGEPEEEAGMSPHQLFAWRWENGLISFLGEEEGGQTVVVDRSLQVVAGPDPEAHDPTHLPVVLGPEYPPRRQVQEPTDVAINMMILSLTKKMALDDFVEKGSREVISDASGTKVSLDELEAEAERLLAKAGVDTKQKYIQMLRDSTALAFDEWTLLWNLTQEEMVRLGRILVLLYGPTFGQGNTTNPAGMYQGIRQKCIEKMEEMLKKNGAPISRFSLKPILTDSCKPKPRPRLRIGVMWGDPHLLTIDGKPYDNQAAGEFVLFDNAATTIQMRTEPVGDDLSQIVAMATRVGDVEVMVGTTDEVVPTAQTFINGELVELERGEVVSVGDGAVLWSGRGWVVVWPDRTVLSILQVHWTSRQLLVSVEPTEGTSTGLLGDGDGNPDNDFVTRGGVQLASNADEDFANFYSTYVDSWRITDAESLFVYGPGENTATFTIVGHPSRPFGIDDLDPEVREEAEGECRASGITSEEVMATCIVDFGATGDRTFIFAAYLAQGFAEASLHWQPDPPPTFEGSCPPPVGGGSARAQVEIEGVCYEFPTSADYTCTNFSTPARGNYIEGSYLHEGAILQFHFGATDWLDKGLLEPYIQVAVPGARGWWSGASRDVPMAIVTFFEVDFDTGVATGLATFYDRNLWETPDRTVELGQGSFEIVCPR